MRLAPTLFFLFAAAVPNAMLARWVLARFRVERHRVIVAAVALTVLPTLSRIALWLWPSSTLTAVLAVALLEVLAAWLTIVPLAAAVIAGRASSGPALGGDGAGALLGRRDAIERITGGAAFGAANLALGWGAVRGRHAFAIEEIVVRVPDWPRALDGYVIAQVSDIHVGTFVGDRELDEGFELVKRVRPDLVVATGDLVDFLADRVSPLLVRLLAVSARDGACAILGNHDHYAGPADVAARVRASGVRLLSNEGVHLRAGDGGGFALLGVDDYQGRRSKVPGFRGPDLGAAIATVRPGLPRVLLAHQPTFFRESAGRVALQLSGHTHGGQINPGLRPAALVLPYVEGRYVEQGSTLWVNRGFGVVGPPARIGAPPEVTKIVVVAG